MLCTLLPDFDRLPYFLKILGKAIVAFTDGRQHGVIVISQKTGWQFLGDIFQRSLAASWGQDGWIGTEKMVEGRFGAVCVDFPCATGRGPVS